MVSGFLWQLERWELPKPLNPERQCILGASKLMSESAGPTSGAQGNTRVSNLFVRSAHDV